jgi:peptidoglycan hydrolase CwlO-like protein
MRGNDIAPSDDFGQAEVFGYSGRAMENSEEQELRRCEAEKEQIRAEYLQVLKNSVAFEMRIRDRWREKNRQKNERIAELEAKVEELERRLAKR